MKKNKVIKEKFWTITERIYEDGSGTLQRTNNGFTLLELIGLVKLAESELIGVMLGNVELKTKKTKGNLLEGKERKIVKG